MESRLDPRTPRSLNAGCGGVESAGERWSPLWRILQSILKIVVVMEEVMGCTLVGLRGRMINKEQHPRPISSRDMGQGQNLNMTGTVWLHGKAYGPGV